MVATVMVTTFAFLRTFAFLLVALGLLVLVARRLVVSHAITNGESVARPRVQTYQGGALGYWAHSSSYSYKIYSYLAPASGP